MIPAESAHDTIAALGEVGLLQFKDLSTHKSAFQRTYANQVCCCILLLCRESGPCQALSDTVSMLRGMGCPACSAFRLHTLCSAPCVLLDGESFVLLLQVKRCDEMARKLRFLTDHVRCARVKSGGGMVL